MNALHQPLMEGCWKTSRTVRHEIRQELVGGERLASAGIMAGKSRKSIAIDFGLFARRH